MGLWKCGKLKIFGNDTLNQYCSHEEIKGG
jgi:hypothetical protein